MPLVALEEKLKTLPQNDLDEVSSFIDYLNYKKSGKPAAFKSTDKTKGFGCLKNIPSRMSADFDAPLEDFKEYM